VSEYPSLSVCDCLCECGLLSCVGVILFSVRVQNSLIHLRLERDAFRRRVRVREQVRFERDAVR